VAGGDRPEEGAQSNEKSFLWVIFNIQETVADSRMMEVWTLAAHLPGAACPTGKQMGLSALISAGNQPAVLH